MLKNAVPIQVLKNLVHKIFKKGLAKPDCQMVEIFSPVKLKMSKKEESGDAKPRNKAKPKGKLKFKTNLMMPSMKKKTKGVLKKMQNPKEIVSTY